MRGTALAAIAVALVSSAAVAEPGDMRIATFLAKADALKAMGPAALMSSDMGLLRREAQAAGEAYRARLTLERARKRPSSCPPQPAPLGSDQLITHMRRYPEAQHGTVTVRRAVADYFIRTWPCRPAG